MTERILTMSQKELGRLEVIQRVVSKQLRQRQAAGPTHAFHSPGQTSGGAATESKAPPGWFHGIGVNALAMPSQRRYARRFCG